MSLTATHTIDAPLADVWRWHTMPSAVHRLTPPFLPMTVISSADSLKDGTTVFSLPAGQKWIARHQPQGKENFLGIKEDFLGAKR